jgi:hypothetical protein
MHSALDNDGPIDYEYAGAVRAMDGATEYGVIFNGNDIAK